MNPQTLRYYERRGLLAEPVWSARGYRAYPPEAVRRVRFIKRAQELGFTLAEVETLLDLAGGRRRPAMISGTRRAIGGWGTAARATVGTLLVGSVLYGHAARGWHPAAWLLGLLVFPAVVVATQWWRARRRQAPLHATGPVRHAVSSAVFLALYLTWWYAPAVDVLSDAALLFYGGSMLLAAARGYAGCEVLAVSNWLLHRDDQVGCAPFGPIDAREARRAARRVPASGVGHGG